jgi:hypothetical protein
LRLRRADIAALLQYHRNCIHKKEIQLRHIFERRDILLEQDAVGIEAGRLAMVDAGRVQANGMDRAVFKQPASGISSACCPPSAK